MHRKIISHVVIMSVVILPYIFIRWIQICRHLLTEDIFMRVFIMVPKIITLPILTMFILAMVHIMDTFLVTKIGSFVIVVFSRRDNTLELLDPCRINILMHVIIMYMAVL